MGGSDFYIEQTSTEPVSFNYLVINKAYRDWGFHKPEISFSGNGFEVYDNGKHSIRFADKSVYCHNVASFVLTGLSIGRRMLNFFGQLYVRDIAI